MSFLQMQLYRGEIVLCQVPMPSTQLQQFKLRPAAIVSSDRLNRILDDVMVVPCTSNTNRLLTATQFLISGNEIAIAGIKVSSVVRCESIFTLNKAMVLRKLGSLSPAAINALEICLKTALSIDGNN